ncbi:Uncharacterized protein APZ42_027496 [Daphnia magna]|uniref:Uncharacterized protein n=1 Tax=Daphnia magna TaxID=35525 RepID=A0A164RMA2_9CRUS|nr:Uncharacterized protein APZ42_027496 [Daphnia magna]
MFGVYLSTRTIFCIPLFHPLFKVERNSSLIVIAGPFLCVTNYVAPAIDCYRFSLVTSAFVFPKARNKTNGTIAKYTWPANSNAIVSPAGTSRKRRDT